jgi:hypothetical protein
MAGELTSIIISDATAIDPKSSIGPSGNGWVAICVLADITNTAGTLAGEKLVIEVSDSGYTDGGVVTTRLRTITGTTFLRRTHPDGDSRMITTDGTDLTLYVALSEVIYSGTTIVSAELEAGFYDGSTAGAAGSITNNSTEFYRKPIGAWLNFNGDTALTDSVDVEFCAASRTAMLAQQVACVEFYAYDGVTTGPSVFSNVPALSQLQTQGNIAESFQAAVDLTGQNQAAFTNINAKIYPHIGDASAVTDLLVDGYAWPTALPLTPLRVFCDDGEIYGGALAYIDGVGAGTPQVSDDPVTAKANPYATLPAALLGIRTWNNANRSHDDFGGAFVYYINDTLSPITYNMTGNTTNSPGLGLTTIGADPLATGEIILAAAVQSKHPENIKFKGVTHKSGASGYTVLGYTSSGTPNSQVFFDNCVADNTDNKNFVAWTSYQYFRNYRLRGGNDIPVATLGPTDRTVPMLVGVVSEDRDSVISNAFPHAAIGCDMPAFDMALANTSEGDHGLFLYNNRFNSMRLNNASSATINKGVANIQNVFEKAAGGSVVCMNVFADGDLTSIDNYIEFHNTAVGERSSRMYNDNPSTHVVPNGLVKLGASKYSIWDNYNIKDDRFNLGNGLGSVGTWQYSYSVGNVGNISLFGAVQRTVGQLPGNTSADVYLGSYWQDSSEPNLLALGSTQTEVMDLFLDYKTAPRSVPAVGGDYRLTADATILMNRVPAGMSALKYDQDGVLRKTNGTGAAGAYEFVGSGGGGVSFSQKLSIGLSVGL